jgi:hypothetical protein
VAYDTRLCSFRFVGNQCFLEVSNVVITSYVVGYKKISTTHKIDIPTQQKIVVR